MEIRTITPDDIPAYQHIVSLAFRRGEQATFTAELLEADDRRRFGVYENGRLQAALGVLDYQMFFGEARRPCGGIFGVASDPATRGRGYAAALIRHSLEDMHERGQYLSSLWPFDFRYYRLFGWEWTGESRLYTIPLRVLKPDAETQYVEGVYDNFAETLNPIYEAMAMRYNGPLVRTPKMWEGKTGLAGNRIRATYVYQRDGQPEGYAILKYGDKSEEIHPENFVALTSRAYRGLLGVIRHHAMTVEKVRWEAGAPPDDPLGSIIMHWDIETKIEPCAMSRVVDVQAALQDLKPSPDLRGTAVVALQDEHAPWNTAHWQITAEGGQVEATRTDATAGVTLDIQAFTQAYWGMPSLLELRRLDRVEMQEESAFDILAALLPEKKAWLYDGF